MFQITQYYRPLKTQSESPIVQAPKKLIFGKKEDRNLLRYLKKIESFTKDVLTFMVRITFKNNPVYNSHQLNQFFVEILDIMAGDDFEDVSKSVSLETALFTFTNCVTNLPPHKIFKMLSFNYQS